MTPPTDATQTVTPTPPPVTAPATTVEAPATSQAKAPVAAAPPGQEEKAPVETREAKKPELTGLEMLNAASAEEDETKIAKHGKQPAAQADPTAQVTAPTPPTAPAPEPTVEDWQTRATKAEAVLSQQAAKTQQAAAEQMSQKQYEDLNERFEALTTLKESVPAKEAEAREALGIFGPNSAEYREAYRDWKAASRNAEASEESYNTRYDGYVSDNQKALEHNYSSYLDATLTPFQLSVKELRKVNPKLALNKPGEVIHAALTTVTTKLTEKYQGEITALQTKLTAAEDKAKAARNKFDFTGAGSRMDKIGDRTPGQGNGFFDLSKPSSDYFRESREQ